MGGMRKYGQGSMDMGLWLLTLIVCLGTVWSQVQRNSVGGGNTSNTTFTTSTTHHTTTMCGGDLGFANTSTTVTTTQTFGPATILIGDDQSQSLFVEAGTEDINTNTDTLTCVLYSHFADRLQVVDPANVLTGDSYVNITNAGTRNGFDPDGGLCANLYVFDPSEEMVACCACYVSPDGLRSFSTQDLISNSLTAAKPNGITIKLLTSAPLSNSTCNPSSAASAGLGTGLRAWSTDLHRNTSTSRYDLTEKPFSFAELSTSELEKLTTFCGFIQSIGSNFGICKECRLGGSLAGATR